LRPTSADHVAVCAHNDAPNGRIGRDLPKRARRKAQGMAHVIGVAHLVDVNADLRGNVTSNCNHSIFARRALY
jgi:hypothetical protein